MRRIKKKSDKSTTPDIISVWEFGESENITPIKWMLDNGCMYKTYTKKSHELSCYNIDNDDGHQELFEGYSLLILGVNSDENGSIEAVDCVVADNNWINENYEEV